MSAILDKAIEYCESITCDKCPRRYKPCIMSSFGEPVINDCTDTTPKDLHEMIDFYSNL